MCSQCVLCGDSLPLSLRQLFNCEGGLDHLACAKTLEPQTWAEIEMMRYLRTKHRVRTPLPGPSRRMYEEGVYPDRNRSRRVPQTAEGCIDTASRTRLPRQVELLSVALQSYSREMNGERCGKSTTNISSISLSGGVVSHTNVWRPRLPSDLTATTSNQT